MSKLSMQSRSRGNKQDGLTNRAKWRWILAVGRHLTGALWCGISESKDFEDFGKASFGPSAVALSRLDSN